MNPTSTIRYITWLFNNAADVPMFKPQLIELTERLLKDDTKKHTLRLLDLLPETSAQASADDILSLLHRYGNLMMDCDASEDFDAYADFERQLYTQYCHITGLHADMNEHDELMYSKLATSYLKDKVLEALHLDKLPFAAQPADVWDQVKPLIKDVAAALMNRSYFTKNYANRRLTFGPNGCQLTDSGSEWDEVLDI